MHREVLGLLAIKPLGGNVAEACSGLARPLWITADALARICSSPTRLERYAILALDLLEQLEQRDGAD
jgi:hypothetical protein